MSSYKKVRGDGNQQNDIASPHNNFIQVFGDGLGKIITCFICLLSASAIGYLFIVYHTIFVVLFFGVVCFFVVIGASAAWRHISHTRKEHLIAENEIKWSEVTHALTESLVAHLDRRDGKVNVVNARDVTEHHNYAPQQTFISEPKSKQLQAGGDGFSDLLGKHTTDG